VEAESLADGSAFFLANTRFQLFILNRLQSS
jgi:hypothetical protein